MSPVLFFVNIEIYGFAILIIYNPLGIIYDSSKINDTNDMLPCIYVWVCADRGQHIFGYRKLIAELMMAGKFSLQAI